MEEKFLITGASGGLGKDLIRSLIDIAKVPPKNIVALYNTHPFPDDWGVHSIQVDLTKLSETDFKNFDINPDNTLINFIHLAGITINKKLIDLTMEDFHNLFQVNITSGLNLVKFLWPMMKKANYGRIIFAGSVVAHLPLFGTVGYAISKASLEAATRVLLAEGIRHNILPYCISLGYMEKGMIEQVPRVFLDDIKTNIPLQRFGTSEEFYKLIMCLLQVPYLAGQTIHLNGGLYFG